MLDANGCAFDYLYIQSNALSHEYKAASPYTNPALRERLKNRVMAGSEGGRPGQWSARKAQLLAARYRAAGGGYKKGSKPTKAQRSLRRWTREKWRTSDNKPALRDGRMRRYLPDKVWGRLTPAQRRATNAKKIRGDRAGRQFVANTEVAARRSRAVRMRSKVLGRPIGGMAEFDGDNDGFLTGPTGEDIFPAPSVRVARRAMRGPSALDIIPAPRMPEGGLPDAANRDDVLAEVIFDPLKVRSALITRRKGLLEKYVPDRKSEDIEEFGDVLLSRMGLLPTRGMDGKQIPMSLAQMLDESMLVMFGDGLRDGVLEMQRAKCSLRALRLRQKLRRGNITDPDERRMIETEIDYYQQLADQIKYWQTLWNNSRNTDRQQLVTEVIRQHLKDSLLQALVGIESQLEKYPHMRGTVEFALARRDEPGFYDEGWEADGYNQRWVGEDGRLHNLVVLNPMGLMARNPPNLGDQVAGNLADGHVTVVGADINPWHLGAHEITHAIHHDEPYRALGLDPTKPLYDQIKRGGPRVGDTRAGMMFALATGIPPDGRWDDIERGWNTSKRTRELTYGEYRIRPIPFDQFVGFRLMKFLESDEQPMINPFTRPDRQRRHLGFAAHLLRRGTGLGGVMKWYDPNKMEFADFFSRLPPHAQVNGKLAMILEMISRDKPTPDLEKWLIDGIRSLGIDVNDNYTSVLDVLTDLLAPELNGQSFEEFMLEGQRLMTEAFGYLPNLHAYKGLTQAHAVVLGTSSLYGGTLAAEAVAETGNLLATIDLVDGITDAVEVLGARWGRAVEIMREEMARMIPPRKPGEVDALGTVPREVWEWHNRFQRLPLRLLRIAAGQQGTP